MGLFAISTLFPVVAGGIPSVQKYRWLGALDGVIALALVVTAMAVASRTRLVVSDVDRLGALTITRAVVNVIPVLLVLFFLAGPRVDWTVLVVGLAWRGWASRLHAALPHGGAGSARCIVTGFRPRYIVMLFISAVVLTLLSSLVSRTRLEVQDWDCPPAPASCARPVIVLGFPLPYVSDYHGISVVGRASLSGALLKEDHFHGGAFVVDLLFYLALSGLVAAALSAMRR